MGLAGAAFQFELVADGKRRVYEGETFRKLTFTEANKGNEEQIMHYKNGREAKNGDKIVQVGNQPGCAPVAGILYNAVPGNDCCNGRIAITSPNDPYANLSDCLHADDVAAATIPDSSAQLEVTSPKTA